MLAGKFTERRNIWAAQEQTIGRCNCLFFKNPLFKALSTSSYRFLLKKNLLLGSSSKNYAASKRYHFCFAKKLDEILEF